MVAVFLTEGHTVLHSSKNDKAELGVSFIVEKEIKDNILDFKPINEHMLNVCLLTFKTKFYNVSIINVHAETEEKDDVTKENVYQRMEQLYASILSNIKII